MYAKGFICFKCKKKYPIEKTIFKCECGGSLDIKYEYDKIKRLIMEERFKREKISHWKYWMFYPIENLNKVITLDEGGTALVKSVMIGEKLKSHLFFKNEGTNPTGSFKDRGSTVEITKAFLSGAKIISCATTGNMGASVACYSARAGMKPLIFVPKGTPKQKLKQIKSYGAKIIHVKGTYEKAAEKAEEFAEKNLKYGYYLAGDYPFRGEGEKSVGFEIIDQLNWNTPDYIVSPMGNGTLIYAVFKALNELKICGLIRKIPKLIGVQAKGCNPIVRAFKTGCEIKPVENPKTIADAVACGNPIDGLEALYALKKTKGLAVDVTDKEILNTMKLLGREGIYSEPGGAVATAGLLKLSKQNPDIFKEKTIVSLVTGNGLKTSF